MSERDEAPRSGPPPQNRVGATVGLNALHLAMQRMSNGCSGPDEISLWRFQVSPMDGTRPLIDVDATFKLLREMRAFLDLAIEVLDTDGGRFRRDESRRADGILQLEAAELQRVAAEKAGRAQR